EIREVRADARLGLRNLVRVVNRDVVFAAAMDIEKIAEIELRHRRAFDMPTGKPASPWTVPFHLPLFAGRRNFPQREVGRMALLRDVNALACFEPLDVEPREIAVIGLRAGVEVDAIGRSVRESFLLEVGDERNLLRDVVGRTAEDRWIFDIEELE